MLHATQRTGCSHSHRYILQQTRILSTKLIVEDLCVSFYPHRCLLLKYLSLLFNIFYHQAIMLNFEAFIHLLNYSTPP